MRTELARLPVPSKIDIPLGDPVGDVRAQPSGYPNPLIAEFNELNDPPVRFAWMSAVLEYEATPILSNAGLNSETKYFALSSAPSNGWCGPSWLDVRA